MFRGARLKRTRTRFLVQVAVPADEERIPKTTEFLQKSRGSFVASSDSIHQSPSMGCPRPWMKRFRTVSPKARRFTVSFPDTFVGNVPLQ